MTSVFVQTQSNQNNYTFYGMALLTGGLCQVVSSNGVGLVTNGFIWQGYDVWFDPGLASPITTGWTPALGYSGSASVITTPWIASQFGSFGEFPG